jgi:hypothetical protein
MVEVKEGYQFCGAGKKVRKQSKKNIYDRLFNALLQTANKQPVSCKIRHSPIGEATTLRICPQCI